MNLEERFHSKYIPEPNTGCWLWTGAKNNCGYGRVMRRSKYIGAHRYSYELHCKKFDASMHVLHKCDVTLCVNPEHLFLGTQADNMADCKRKGRHRHVPSRGMKNGNSKLTDAIVKEIRSSNLSHVELAEKYNVDYTLVWQVRKRKIWKHIED